MTATTREAAHERRRRIQRDVLRAAARQVLDQGRDITLREVTAAAGIGAPTLYRYFADMAALERDVAQDIRTELLAEIAAATGAVSETDLTGRMAAAWTVLRQFQQEHPRRWVFVISTSDAGAALFEAIGEHITALVDARTAGAR